MGAVYCVRWEAGKGAYLSHASIPLSAIAKERNKKESNIRNMLGCKGLQ